jgi:hypothetical protein
MTVLTGFVKIRLVPWPPPYEASRRYTCSQMEIAGRSLGEPWHEVKIPDHLTHVKHSLVQPTGDARPTRDDF